MSDAPDRAWPTGWYRDPWFAGQERYWDGAAWTPHTRASAAAYAPSWPAASQARPEPAWAPATSSPGNGGGATTGWGSGDDAYAPSWASPGGGSGWLGGSPDPGPGTGTPTAPRRGRWVALGVIAVAVAIAAAAITVASGAGREKRVAARLPIGNGGANGGATPLPGTTIPPASSNDPSAGLLNGLDVSQADAPPGFGVRLVDGGNLVVGQVTLDLCNGTFASESLRTARRQVDLDDQGGNSVLSTEAVLYTNPAATAQAFSELKARAASCPQSYLPPPPGEAGLAPTKTTFTAPPDAAWPNVAGVDRLAYAFTTADQQGNSENSITVYLRHGRAFLGLYFLNPGQTTPAIAGKTTVESIVQVFEQRLAALPSSAVNATVHVPPPNGGI